MSSVFRKNEPSYDSTNYTWTANRYLETYGIRFLGVLAWHTYGPSSLQSGVLDRFIPKLWSLAVCYSESREACASTWEYLKGVSCLDSDCASRRRHTRLRYRNCHNGNAVLHVRCNCRPRLSYLGSAQWPLKNCKPVALLLSTPVSIRRLGIMASRCDRRRR